MALKMGYFTKKPMKKLDETMNEENIFILEIITEIKIELHMEKG